MAARIDKIVISELAATDLVTILIQRWHRAEGFVSEGDDNDDDDDER